MSDKEIVDRLKIEGDLTRNKGKHSVKAVLLKMDKFQDLFMSIDKSLMEQTAILRTNLSLNAEEVERLKREANFRQNSQQSPEAVVPKERSTPMPSAGATTDKSFFGGIAAMIGGAFSGVGLSAFRGVIGKSVIGAFGLFLAPAIGNWASDFIEQSLKNLNFDDITASVAGDALGNATTMGILGSIISKRMGLLFAGGGFVASFADDIASALGFTEEQMQQDLIMGLSAADVSQGVMFAIGTTLSGILMKKSIWSGLFSMSGSAVSAILSKTGLGVLAKTTIPMAVAGLYLTYGEEAKKFLDNYVPEDIANVTVDSLGMAATGATIGMMFGPGGMIAGAAIGFALGLGKTIFDWLGERKKEADEEYRKKLDAMTNDDVVEAFRKDDFNFLSPSSIEKERLKTVPAVTMAENLPTTESPTEEIWTRGMLDQVLEKIETEDLSMTELNKIFTSVSSYNAAIQKLKEKVASDPMKYGQDSSEGNSLSLIETQGVDDDVQELLRILQDKGAKILPQMEVPNRKRPEFIPLPNTFPEAAITLEPPANTGALQATMNAGVAEKTAQLNMVQMGGPKIFNSGGNSNVTNNSSVNVVTGSENKLFGLGFAQ